jgi:hypothetical protein
VLHLAEDLGNRLRIQLRTVGGDPLEAQITLLSRGLCLRPLIGLDFDSTSGKGAYARRMIPRRTRS